MHMKMRLTLSCHSAAVLEDVHSPGTEGLGRGLRDLSHKTIHALHFTTPNVQNGLTMGPRYDEHCSALVLTLIDFGNCVLILGNNHALPDA